MWREVLQLCRGIVEAAVKHVTVDLTSTGIAVQTDGWQELVLLAGLLCINSPESESHPKHPPTIPFRKSKSRLAFLLSKVPSTAALQAEAACRG